MRSASVFLALVPDLDDSPHTDGHRQRCLANVHAYTSSALTTRDIEQRTSVSGVPLTQA